MPRVEFEPTVPVSARAKTIHALGRTATVTAHAELLSSNITGTTACVNSSVFPRCFLVTGLT
jgi:hypothetical protein